MAVFVAGSGSVNFDGFLDSGLLSAQAAQNLSGTLPLGWEPYAVSRNHFEVLSFQPDANNEKGYLQARVLVVAGDGTLDPASPDDRLSGIASVQLSLVLDLTVPGSPPLSNDVVSAWSLSDVSLPTQRLYAALAIGDTATIREMLVDALSGDDEIYLSDGFDVMYGFDGNDVIYGYGGGDTIDGGAGDDLIDAGLSVSQDIAVTRLIGGTGNDRFVVYDNRTQVVELVGEGTDEVAVADPHAGRRWQLTQGIENASLANSVRYDVIGNELANRITGNGAANVLAGKDGDDSLSGLDGKDTLTGGAGRDRLDGGAGADTMLGGAGDDIYVVDNAADRVFETVTASSAVDAGGGFDLVQSAVSFNLAADQGVAFVEKLLLTGTAAINGTGNALDNAITGNGAANALSGGAGNDILTGGAGNDTLTGGAGADRFLFGTGSLGNDLIKDFRRADGDKIALDLIDAKAGTTANDAFTFIGTAVFGKVAGQLRAAASGTTTVIQGDTNGDGVADFQITLTGAVTLAAGDFVL